MLKSIKSHPARLDRSPTFTLHTTPLLYTTVLHYCAHVPSSTIHSVSTPVLHPIAEFIYINLPFPDVSRIGREHTAWVSSRTSTIHTAFFWQKKPGCLPPHNMAPTLLYYAPQRRQTTWAGTCKRTILELLDS